MSGLLIGAGLIVLAFGLAWVGSWDRGPNPRQALTADERRRREHGVSEVDRLAHRAAYLRSCEDGVCCCTYHGQIWCQVHGGEGEALTVDDLAGVFEGGPYSVTWLRDQRSKGEALPPGAA